jgi:hypothetical protein
VAAFLGGCNSSEPGDPSAGATTTASSPTSSGASGTAGATATATSPVRAVTNDLAAKAAVTQLHIYYAEYNLMLTSGVSERFRQTFARSCRQCVLDAARIDRFESRGQRVEGGICTLSKLRVTEVHREVVVVQGVLSETSMRVLSGDRVVNRFPAMPPTKMSWTASQATGGWLVIRADPVS